MNRVLLLLAGVAIGIAAMRIYYERGALETAGPPTTQATDDDEHAAPSRAESAAGVTLTPAEIALAGLELGRLRPARLTPEIATAGRVANAADLLALLRDLRSARDTAAASRAVAAALGARVARLRKLEAAGEIAAARELAALDVEHRRELARVAAREAKLGQVETALLARWGNGVAALAREARSPLARIEEGEQLLVEFVAEDEPPGTVYVAAGEARADAVAARLIGPAAAALGGAHGASWLAAAPREGLRAGMPVTVWIPRASAPLEGMVLPAAAVVWHRGAQWYYATDDDTHFSRRPLGAAPSYGSDFLLPAAGAPQGSVVLRGAQSLLAEEFRGTIPDEDDD